MKIKNLGLTLKNESDAPLVSVVMPVYNAQEFLADAVESILNQTYKNLEFIIVDDASTDDSYKILKAYAKVDKRIKILRNEKNSGISISVKKAMNQVKGDYVARMDADDISLPNRLALQVKYLQSHPETVAIGGQCVLIDRYGKIFGEKKFPTEFKDIYKYIFQFVPLQQPSLMIAAKRLPHDFQYYRDGMNTAEEIELIFKLFMYGKVENLPDILLLYRIHEGNTSFKNIKKTFYLTIFSRLQAMIWYNYKPTLMGVLVTLTQLVAVFLLPQTVIFGLYKVFRKLSTHEKMGSVKNYNLSTQPAVVYHKLV